MHSPLPPETLLSADNQIYIPYDLMGATELTNFRLLSSQIKTCHYERAPFDLDINRLDHLVILNGMGISLGDSLCGLSVLQGMTRLNPQLKITLLRAANAPHYVEEIYRVANFGLQPIQYCPYPLTNLPANATLVDLSEIIVRPDLAQMPLTDFFWKALGLGAMEMPAGVNTNAWIQTLPLPMLPADWEKKPYILFCGQASTRLRSIPEILAESIVDRLWHKYNLPIVGMGPLKHPHYTNIANASLQLLQFMRWIRQADLVFSTDSAAIHLAAGFEVPTVAGFVTIPPQNRIAHYPLCNGIDLTNVNLIGLHLSEENQRVHLAHQQWQAWLERTVLL